LFQKLKSFTNICDFGQNIPVILTEIVENSDILRTVLSGKNGHGWVPCYKKFGALNVFQKSELSL